MKQGETMRAETMAAREFPSTSDLPLSEVVFLFGGLS